LNNLTKISVTAPPEIVLKLLSKHNIAAFNLKKEGNCVTFQVRDESRKKVFAIFKHSCYNVNIKKNSAKNSYLKFVRNRCGLIVGGIIFLLAVILSNCFVLKIQVTGNGDYLKNDVLAILSDEGATLGSLQTNLDKPLAQARIMSLPNVTFCTIQRAGSFLIVDVQTDEEQSAGENLSQLKSDVEGRLKSLVVICGTAQAEVGKEVKVNDCLIEGYTLDDNGQRRTCLAVGYAEIERSANINVCQPFDSEENRAEALNSTLLYSDNAVIKSCNVKQVDGGVVYEISFTYLHTISINMQ
jgi:hypothetical protein